MSVSFDDLTTIMQIMKKKKKNGGNDDGAKNEETPEYYSLPINCISAGIMYFGVIVICSISNKLCTVPFVIYDHDIVTV